MNALLSPFLHAHGRRSLKFELIVVLAVKAVLLFALKELFFSHPAAENMQLPPAVVAHTLLDVPGPAEGSHHAK